MTGRAARWLGRFLIATLSPAASSLASGRLLFGVAVHALGALAIAFCLAHALDVPRSLLAAAGVLAVLVAPALRTESLPPKLRAALVRKRDRYEQALRRVIAEGVRSGELVDMDPAIVTRAMLGAMNWTVTWFRPGGASSADTVGDLIAHFLVRGIASRTPVSRRSLAVVRTGRPKDAAAS